MKKRISAIFVLLTGTLLLALSVLPHHHHGERIRFVAPERCAECLGHVPCCGGDDDHGGSDTNCDLRYLFVMYGRGGSQPVVQTVDQQGDPTDGGHFPIALFLNSVFTFDARVYAETTVFFAPFAEPAGRPVAAALPLLRAPPVFIA